METFDGGFVEQPEESPHPSGEAPPDDRPLSFKVYASCHEDRDPDGPYREMDGRAEGLRRGIGMREAIFSVVVSAENILRRWLRRRPKRRPWKRSEIKRRVTRNVVSNSNRMAPEINNGEISHVGRTVE